MNTPAKLLSHAAGTETRRAPHAHPRRGGGPYPPRPSRTPPAAPAVLALCLAAILAAAGCGGSGDAVRAASDAVLDSYPIDIPTPPPDASGHRGMPDADSRAVAASRARAEGAAGATVAPAAEAPEGFLDALPREADRIPMTLEACLRRALANNLRVQIARFGPAIARTRVIEAEALFDPSWFLNNALSRVRQDAGTFLAGAATLVAKQWQFDTGVETLLPTGATVGLSQDWTYIDSSSAFFMPNPQYDTDLNLVVRQPLLRGAGLEVTKSPIVLARLDHRVSLADFKARVMDVLLEVEVVYWDLVVAETRIQAITEALEAARENQRIAQRRFEEGKAKRLVVSLAESAVTQRETDLVAARLVLARTSDRLKRLVNDTALPLEEPLLLKAAERPMTDPVPVGRRLYQMSMLAAMKYRPEMDQASAALDQAVVRERVARNQRLPQLDLAGAYTLNGLDADIGPAMDEQFETTYFDWTVGLEFRIPIGNRARTAAHERSRLQKAVAVRQREDARQQILLEVSQAVRDLAAAEESILASRAAREAAEQTLADQKANVAAGAALVKDLLEAQRDLADAKVQEMRAMAAYMVSLAQLERAKGTLLEYNNIMVLDEAGSARPPAAAKPAAGPAAAPQGENE
jgi:outer membrane protein TolC